MVNTTTSKVDLTASNARVVSARKFADYQTRLVEGGKTDKLQIDLMFLAHEQVRVMDDTHKMLQALEGQRRLSPNTVISKIEVAPPRKLSVQSVLTTLQATASGLLVAILIEFVDPAPIDILASTFFAVIN